MDISPEIVTAGFTLITVAGSAMWMSLKQDHNRLSLRADGCEEDRKKMHLELRSLSIAIGVLRGCRKVDCPVAETLSQFE